MNRQSFTPATIGAGLAAIGSGLVALINLRNIGVLLLFVAVFFVALVTLLILIAKIAGRQSNDS